VAVAVLLLSILVSSCLAVYYRRRAHAAERRADEAAREALLAAQEAAVAMNLDWEMIRTMLERGQPTTVEMALAAHRQRRRRNIERR